MLIDPQDRCLDCNYPLDGLPRPHRCPECGRPFDDVTIVFRPSRPWVLYLTVLGLWILAIYMFQGCIWGVIVSVKPAFGIPLVVFLAGFGIVSSLYRVWKSNRVGRFVAFTEDSVVLRTHKHELETIPFSEITLVSVVDWAPWIKRRGIDQEIPLNRIFDGKRERDEFKHRLTELIERANRAETGSTINVDRPPPITVSFPRGSEESRA